MAAPDRGLRERGAVMTGSSYRRRDLSPDQQLALRAASADLQQQFVGVFGVQTIERFLHSSYDEFAGAATVATFLPLLAHRFARERLRALARVEGVSRDTRPTVLFLCTQNAGRSQMALGFLHDLAGDRVIGWSGGLIPAEVVEPVVLAAMAERGIDISHELPKPWTDELVGAADVVVTLGCRRRLPDFPGKRYVDWELDDPAGHGLDEVRLIRNATERRVRSLLTEIGIQARSPAATVDTALASRIGPHRLTGLQYQVLQAVADGRVERGVLLGSLEPHVLDGRDVIRSLRGLVLRGLVVLAPIGSPSITRRGRAVLDSRN